MTSSHDHEATISSDTFPIPFIVTPKTAGAEEPAESDTAEKKETASETSVAAKPTESGGAGSDPADNRGTAEARKHEDGRDSTASDEVEAEADSPLDNANFLSFEEWKRQNLAKAGQSPENVGQGRGSHGGPVRKARPININNELDFLGEDTEIELDFGFGSNAKVDQAASVSTRTGGGDGENGAAGTKEAPASYRPRSKDAGKTCKERFNYASFDCAATVLKTNPQCKSSSSVLVENKDSYMINECGAQNKFVIVELCDDILVDTIVLANFEFFSSQFRVFRVSVSDRYPVKLERWKELGVFEARNSRDIQSFLVENPLIWARYLRIEFLSHYGNEYYCPVSLLRVHGTTMMEEFRHQEEAARGEDDMEEPDTAPAESAVNVKASSTSERSHSPSSNTPDASAGNTTWATTAGSSPASEARVVPSGEARQQNASSQTGSPRSSSQPSTDSSKQQTASSTQAQQPAAPTTQESFFKSIHKRLQMLESNSTLSLQYIEDQSRILRDAFAKVEKRQLGKTEKFLKQLNDTVMSELRGFRQQYDQLWQSTVIELDTQREQHQREVVAISARLSLVADELVFQKRILVVQSTLILLCLGLVLFARAGHPYLELPLVQHMMHKSQSALRLQFDSPSSSPGPPESRLALGLGHRRNASSGDERRRFRFFGAGGGGANYTSDASVEGGAEEARSPTLEFEAPTPTSDRDGDGDGDGDSGSGPNGLDIGEED
ncbi:hypothetical protein K490DRAFT_43332 [Saccharata proteae CBS 121410]|uniref:SUN domain-containing protein n=1 Tax=Saccharata proteae CBS 121410 TaxID=1314787 RepID=A0A9P4HVV9_9PEZI|nr:hypothetical protein K490DRAFT_43332 [Saccharata proteae CBS 121410]